MRALDGVWSFFRFPEFHGTGHTNSNDGLNDHKDTFASGNGVTAELA